MPAINLAALLDDKEENLKHEQMNVMYVSIMDLLGDPGNPLYAEPHSMAEHAIGELPSHTHCKGGNVTARVYEDETPKSSRKYYGASL